MKKGGREPMRLGISTRLLRKLWWRSSLVLLRLAETRVEEKMRYRGERMKDWQVAACWVGDILWRLRSEEKFGRGFVRWTGGRRMGGRPCARGKC